MEWTLTFVVLLIIICLRIVLKHRQKCSFWKRQNVELISSLHFFQETRKEHLYKIIGRIYTKMCAEQRSCTVVEAFVTSTAIMQDQNAIREVLTSQFENFPDRGFYVNRRDPMLVHMARFHYDIWKPLRKKLTPAFSPTKLKSIFPTMAEVGDQLVRVLNEQIAGGDSVVEMHDFSKRFSVDVIGSVAFGIDCNSLKDPQAEFKLQGDKAVKEHFRPFIDQFAQQYSKFMNFINFKYHSKKSIDFFTTIVKETLEYREKYQIKRNDFIDSMMEFRNNENENKGDGFSLSLEMMVGQVFLFFIAGYESTSAALCQALYEISLNPRLQEKARLEILQVTKEHDNKITYESLSSLKYTKQIVLETLRKYPIVHTIMRFCRHTCSISTTKGSLTIPKDTTVFIPAYGIHHNPEFYPNPELFLPERFTEEEVAKRPPFTFLTFGDGPRNCLASKFGLMELILGLSTLLLHFRFSICEQSPKEIEFNKKVRFNLNISNGIYLRLDKL